MGSENRVTALRRPSIRARLTLGAAALLFATGLSLLAINYFLVSEALDTGATTTTTGAGDVLTPAPRPDPRARVLRLTQAELEQRLAEARAELRESTLDTLLGQSFAVLAVVGVAAVALGSLTARRVLRPIHSITETARRVADSRLHERLALDGPEDELKELADTFDDMLERLDHSFSAQRRFVGDASHELRTPLAITRVVLEVAGAKRGSCEHVRALAERLLEVNGRQERLIEGLLLLARSDRALARVEDVDLGAVGGATVPQVAAEAEAAGVRLDHHLDPAPARGDATLLEQVFLNLLQNGVRHNAPGGHVRVATGRDGDHAVIAVDNTGPLVAPEEVDGLFEPFRRGEDRPAGGVGLGLSIVRTIVRTHGGVVSAVARPGGGLSVRVRLPRAQPASPNPASTSRVTSAKTGSTPSAP